MDVCKIAALPILGWKAKCFPFLVTAFGMQQLRQQRKSHGSTWKQQVLWKTLKLCSKWRLSSFSSHFLFFLFLPILFLTWNNNSNTWEREDLAYNAYLAKAWDAKGTESSCATLWGESGHGSFAGAHAAEWGWQLSEHSEDVRVIFSHIKMF